MEKGRTIAKMVILIHSLIELEPKVWTSHIRIFLFWMPTLMTSHVPCHALWSTELWCVCILPSPVSLHPIHQIQKLATILKSHTFTFNVTCCNITIIDSHSSATKWKCWWDQFYRLKLRITDLAKGTGHMLHAEPSTCQLPPLDRSGHSAQCLGQGCLEVVIWHKTTVLYIFGMHIESKYGSWWKKKILYYS